MDSQPKILPKKGERNILITSALPYVNNVPHLGNIVGSLLSADVFSRYNKARGRPTLYVCGTDEYGTATEVKSLEEGVTPRELCDKYSRIHAEIYEWFEIKFDIFGRTSTTKQTEITQGIFRQLYQNGYTTQRSSRQPYCEKHKGFLADRYIEGTCPKCGYEDARGDQCDQCGSVDYEPLDLKDARCKVDPDVTPIAKDTKHIHLLLDKLQPRVEEWVHSSSQKGAWSSNSRIITESWLKQGLRDRGITRDLKWGVPIPLDVFNNDEDRGIYESKVFYVWFDACIGYPSITATYTEEWEQWWKNPENVQLYQFQGKDNVPFHALIFPSCQIGTGDNWTMLHHLSATEYLNYEKGKFSKSRGIGVFGNNAKDTGVLADVWRYYLLKSRPETGDTQFEWQTFIERNNNELLAKLGNFVNRVIRLVNSKIYNSIIPDYTKMHSHPDFAKVKQDINTLLKQYIGDLEAVKLRAGIHSAMEIAEAGNNFLQSNKFDNKLVASEPEKAAAITGIAINLILLCASVFEPYLPATSRSILEQLQAPFLYIPDEWTADDIKPSHQIGKAKYLFSHIDEKKADEWRELYGGTQADRLQRDEETAKKAAKKVADKARKAARKLGKSETSGEAKESKMLEPMSVEASAVQDASPMEVGKEPVDAVTDGVQQVTLPKS
ncbi:putative methionine--tRNA ligase, cytoplasmic protein rar1 [Varicellaria rhodocarpa]|nr:putative methionine--tRNA ligase, cytoplasmic protein rar1 [Varicellaria rhodocarpa]